MAESELKKGDRVLWVTSDLSDFGLLKVRAKRTGIIYEREFYKTENSKREL